MNSVLEITDLNKTFHGGSGSRGQVVAVDGISLDVAPGEMIVLLGPSGCGKTTLLRCVAGLEQPDGGEIRIAGNVVFSSSSRVSLPPEKRSLSMMFQSYALWPHMTAFENVAYPLRARGALRPNEVKQRVSEALEVVAVAHLANEHPSTMSGGQQQRVALARALVAETKLILFDEPLSNVDARVRDDLLHEIKRMQARFEFAGLYVTHDRSEALALGDRVVVVRDGRIVELGTPGNMYHRPRERYTARFVGASNEYEGSCSRTPEGAIQVHTPLGFVISHRDDSRVQDGEQAVAIFRPGSCSVERGAATTPEINQWTGRVRTASFRGSHLELTVEVDEATIRAWGGPRSDIGQGDEVTVSVDPEEVLVFAREAPSRGGSVPA